MKVVLALLLGAAAAQGPGTAPDKNTYACTDPTAAWNWFHAYLPVYDADDGCGPPDDDDCHGCGDQGRVALCQDESCSPDVSEVSSGFGIHTVNASTRPFGDTNVDVIEATFDARISAALGGLQRKYDAVMDFSTVLYADDLSTYLESFDAADQDYLGLEWSDDGGTSRYSAIVQVPSTMVIFELVSSTAPSTSTWSSHAIDDDLARLPASTFESLSFRTELNGTSSKILTPLAISRATSNLSTISSWYSTMTEANEAQTFGAESESQSATLANFIIAQDQDLPTRFIQRSADVEAIKAIEDIKNGAHAALNKDTEHYCGFDKYFDSHTGSPGHGLSLDALKEKLDSTGSFYHIWESPGYDMYAADPTGEAIQLMGQWNSQPSGASGNAGDLCCQGSSTCSSVGTCTMSDADTPTWA